MRVHEISSIGKVTLDAFSFYVIIVEIGKGRFLEGYLTLITFFHFREPLPYPLPNAVLILIVSFFPFCAPLGYPYGITLFTSLYPI